jgi:5'-3' exonuclease
MAINFSSLGNQVQNGNLLIVDGLNVAFRWKHSKQLEYKHDYVRTVESLAKSYDCGNIVILADGGSTYRKRLSPDYKANRSDKYAEQTAQEKAEFAQFMGEFKNAFSQAAWIVGKKAEFGIGQIWMVSSDRDWDLLIQDGVSRFSTVTRKEITIDNWEDHYDVEPSMYLTQKCLAGDTGDNVPGIAGIGPKRAIALIEQYGDLFDIYNACPISSKYKFIQSLNENAERLLLNAELMDLVSYSEQALIEAEMNLEDLSSKILEYLNDTD